MVEQTFVFIKPDGVQRKLAGRILTRFEDRGFTLKRIQLLNLTAEQVDEHYSEHVGKPFFASLKEYVMSGPVLAMVVEGPNAVAVVRKMCGVTNAAEAEPGTIRGDFALTMGENIIHSSDSPEAATREISNFFK